MLPIRKRVTIRPTRVCGFKAIRIPKTCGVQGRIDARRPSRVEENPQNEGRRRQQRQKIAGRPHARELAYNSGELTCLNINCHGCVDVVLYRDSRDAAAADRSCAGPVIDESYIHTYSDDESRIRLKNQDSRLTTTTTLSRLSFSSTNKQRV